MVTGSSVPALGPRGAVGEVLWLGLVVCNAGSAKRLQRIRDWMGISGFWLERSLVVPIDRNLDFCYYFKCTSMRF